MRINSSILSTIAAFGLLLIGAQARAEGAQSLRLQPGRIGSFNIPSTSPYTALGDFRVEMRVSGFSGCPQNYANICDFGALVFRCFLAGGTELNVADGAASRGVNVPMAARPDAILRI